MKKCTLSDIMFYAMDGLNATYCILRVVLDQPVKKDVMTESFARACNRFPYFQTRLKKLDSGFDLVPNEKAPVMHEDPLEYIINASENDGFLYRFSVFENTVTFSMFHGLTDGSGALAFLKVVLADYYAKLGESIVPPKDLYDINGTPDLEETADPLDLIPPDTPIVSDYGGKFFSVPGKVGKQFFSYTFSANADKIMQYASSSDGSPNAIAAIIMAKSICELHPESMKDGIDIGVAINAKPIVGVPKSHWPFLETSTFHFDQQKMEMDDELLHTCVRGKIFADCSEEKLLPALAGVRSVGNIFEYVADDKARQLLCLKSTEQPRATASVSYAGISDFGSIGEHISGLYSFCDAAAPIMEINYNNGTFYFSLSSHFDVKVYAAKIWEHFNELGFECSELKRIQFYPAHGKKDKPKFGFNLPTLHLISGIKTYKRVIGDGSI